MADFAEIGEIVSRCMGRAIAANPLANAVP
jgi:hypothetical protein